MQIPKLMDILKSILVWLIGICYIAITFPITLLIWLLTYPFDRKKAIIHWLLVNQSYILVHLIPIWTIHFEGREKAVKENTYVIISNHQSLLDILIINSLRYNFRWISKIENFKVPVIGWYLKMADYIVVDRGNEESKTNMLNKSFECLNNGVSIMMFPEGTRSADNKIGFFKRGAFQLAMQAGIPILPVLLDGTGGILPKHGLIFGSGYQIKVKVLDPVLPSGFNVESPEELAEHFSRMMTMQLEQWRQLK